MPGASLSAMYRHLNDITLFHLLADGDEAAFNEIYQRFHGLLYVYACRITREESEAEDIVQELFISLWDRRSSLDVKGSPAGFLYSAVRYKFFDRLDKQRVRKGYQDAFRHFLEQGEYLTDQYVRERELAQLIEKEIRSLPSKMQEIFHLSRKDHLSHKEIAARLGLSEKTVKNQVNNARKILRTRIGWLAWVIYLLQH